MKKGSLIAIVVAVVVAFLAYGSLYTVNQTQQALVLQFGNPVDVVKTPGLHVKLPFIQNVEYYDNRILDLDPPGQEVILRDQKRINVDSFARYRIVDPLEFRKRAFTDSNFRQIFGQRLNAAVRAEVGQVLLGDLLTEKRASVMEQISKQMKEQAPEFGVQVVDVRIGRTDLPQATAQSVYSRMKSERNAQATELRAQGERQAKEITALANRSRVEILAEAQRQAQILRGEGEAERTRVLLQAFGKDPGFFDFYRSMEAYGQAFKKGTTMVLSPDSEFFRYFGKVDDNLEKDGGKSKGAADK